jgi:hypothetical protein
MPPAREKEMALRTPSGKATLKKRYVMSSTGFPVLQW